MQEKSKKTTKEDKKVMDFIKKSFEDIGNLLNEDKSNLNQPDKVYWIARSLARNMPNELTIIWTLEAILDAFEAELEDWNKNKKEARDKVGERLKIFNSQFDEPNLITEKKNKVLN